MTHPATKPSGAKFTKRSPNKPGWWIFREPSMPDQKLLIVGAGKHFEVAEDSALEEETGREVGAEENYWEMTPCKDMRHGLWMFHSDCPPTPAAKGAA